MSSAEIKNTFTSIGELDASVPPSSLILKLAISEQSIRFFIQSLTHDQIIYFGNYTLHHVENAEDLALRLERIIEKDEALQLTFAKVLVGIDSGYSLIPSELYFPVEPSEDISINQKIPAAGLDMVFGIDVILNYKLKSLFRNASIIHLNSAFLNVLPDHNSEATDQLFVNIEKGYFDIIRFNEKNQLQLMNRYHYKNETDFTYFLLLCCEELKIDREKTKLILMGEVDIQSRIYDMCYRYFRTVNFIQPTYKVQFSKAFHLFPKHLHFNLYNLSA